MKQILFTLISVLFILCAEAQKQHTTIYQACRLANDLRVLDGDGIIFDSCPQFKNGQNDLFKYLSKQIRYPAIAKYKGVQGRVIISMVIEKNGSLSDIKVVRAIGDGCDEEAVRVMKSCPKWKPGVLHGKPVRVKYYIPVPFKLPDRK